MWIPSLVRFTKSELPEAGHKKSFFKQPYFIRAWRRARQPIPVLLPEESHGQRSLAGYSPWDHKDSDMTEVT